MSSHHDSKSGKKTEHNIIDLVVKDHATVKQLYKEIQSADDHEGDKLFQKMCWEISLHAVAEELVLYPLQESLDKEGVELAKESREDHEKTKEALRELDGKHLKEKGVRNLVDEMMKDLIEHMEKEETGDLVKLKEDVSEEKLQVAGRDFEQVKSLVPDVASSNQARSEKQVDKSEEDSHFKTPMSLLLASKDKLQAILGKHGPSESVSINKGDAKGHGHETKGHGHEAKGHAHEKSESGNEIHYNLRHRDEKGHVVHDEADAADNASHGGKNQEKSPSKASHDHEKHSSHAHSGEKASHDGHKNRSEDLSNDQEDVEMSSQKSGKAHANGHKNGGSGSAGGHEAGDNQHKQGKGEDSDGETNQHGKRGKEESADASSRKKLADSHGEHMEVDAGSKKA